MSSAVNQLTGSPISTTAGETGHVIDAYFDDPAWAVRYLVVGTGNRLAGCEVLISPDAIRPPLGMI